MRIAPRIFILILLSTSPGCEVVSAIAGKTMPQSQAAHYTPKNNKPLLVVAENYRDPAGASVVDADQLARFISDDLGNHKVAPIIDPAKATEQRSRDAARFRGLPITQIGESAGARQVLYISVISTSIDQPAGSEMIRGQAAALIRIIDVKTGQSLWPTDATDGYPVSTATPMVQTGAGVDETEIRQALQQQLGLQIARLFYRFDPDAE